MFESTLPLGAPDLMRVSVFQRHLDEMVRSGDLDSASTRLSSLSPSMMQDLLRFERNGRQSEVLEVMAASVRHARNLTIHLEDESRVLPLTVFPRERLVHCPLAIDGWIDQRINDVQVLHVEPAMLQPLGHPDPLRRGDAEHYAPLGPLLWELAMRGNRDELLPEIAGAAAYRISPSVNLAGLSLSGSLAAAVNRLKRQTTNLREMAEWPGFDRARAMRLLNALYLQAGLMITRTHPAATNESWFGGLR